MNIVQNLKDLIAAVEAQPESQFDLTYYKKVEPCGTIFCTAGLATTMPQFAAMGMEFVRVNEAFGTAYVAVDGVDIDEAVKLDSIFGDRAWVRLFASRGCGILDGDVDGADEVAYDSWWENPEYEIPASVTDKQLALWRLKKQLAIYEGESNV